MLNGIQHCSGAKEARNRGLKHFTRDKPCPRGHVGVVFYASSGACMVCDAAKVKRYREDNPDKVKQANKNWRSANEKYLATTMWLWSRANRGKKNALEAKREAAKAQRTPAWADLAAIRAFYEACPAGMQVDHIVPLQGGNVCGLHVLNNLQYLTPTQNASKGNRYVG